MMLWLTALALATQGSRTPPPPAMLFHCEERIANFEGFGALNLDRRFREDGSPLSRDVTLESRESNVISGLAAGDQAGMTLRWPGNHSGSLAHGPSFWSEGSIDIYFFSGTSNRYVTQRNERWRRVLVDRDDSLRVYYRRNRDNGIFMPGLDLHLTSELQPLSSPGRLWMSLDNLLIWGSGRGHVTVYETVVTGRRPQGRNWDTPIGNERVVGTYQIDIPALARLAARVRAAAETWEAGLTDLASRCRREPEETGDIVVTDARIARPDR